MKVKTYHITYGMQWQNLRESYSLCLGHAIFEFVMLAGNPSASTSDVKKN